jgi:RNA polymerase sigma-70 factor, ECF subfamily
MTTNDIEILRFLDGDDDAYAAVYHRYKRQVFEFSCRMLSDADLAGDVVQAVFLKIWERRGQLRVPDRFYAWMMTAARNECLSLIRKRHLVTELSEELSDEGLAGQADNLQRADECSIISAALGRLKPALREVVVLREFHDLSYNEIAAIIGVDENLVRSRLFSARQKLHAMLKPILMEGNGL